MYAQKFPIAKLLKGKLLRIAELQDIVLLELLKKFDFTLHGGTAIWRIYGGKRFSFDVDVYSEEPERIMKHFLTLKNFEILKKKLTPSNVLYLRIRQTEEIELEVSPFFRKPKTVERDFWLTDGSTIVVKTLSPEGLIAEKIRAFSNRKKARDLYDVYYLLDYCKIGEIMGQLDLLLKNLEEPEDFDGLRDLILLGNSPNFETIAEKVKRYAKDQV
jgi:predicted nucleotidyltransferase component of viral defense system